MLQREPIDFDPTGPGSRFLSQLLSHIWNSPTQQAESDSCKGADDLKRLRRVRWRNDCIMRGVGGF